MLKIILLANLIVLIACSGTIYAADKKSSTRITKAESSQLRCWQQGKLLFTEMNWDSFTIANKENVLNFTKEEKDSKTLSLINLGDTVCLYQKTD